MMVGPEGGASFEPPAAQPRNAGHRRGAGHPADLAAERQGLTGEAALHHRLGGLARAVLEGESPPIRPPDLGAFQSAVASSHRQGPRALFPAGTRARAATLVLAVSALALLAGRWWLQRPLSLTVTRLPGAAVPDPHGPGERWRFSDGSELHARPGARLRPLDLHCQRPTLALDDGAARLTVAPACGPFRVIAGPFQATLAPGTVDLTWIGRQELLTILVSEGEALVRGPSLPAAGQRVLAGEMAVVHRPSDSVRLIRGTAAPGRLSEDADPGSNGAGEATTPGTSSPAEAPPPSSAGEPHSRARGPKSAKDALDAKESNAALART